ncbi:Transducin/WD40 repeat protein [Quillaja saponaria]|uniref:Transducin/WD40 repeat protein n=1 Tax=Quillaja saponaria TaxID=32244 RepID=A0AAD7P6J9_QUISA|nr:Transducin/WD40 repeat protein [Quillaja saponaria]
MFVKKLVEKASKKPGGNGPELKASDVDPRLVFHYGIPSGGAKFAYDNIQKILALSTKDGRIKLFGKDNTQAVLESSEAVPSKFLQFIENQGILLNVTYSNHIEVWDIDKKLLSDVHICEEEITSFTVIQYSLCMYIGDSAGNISVLKLDQEPCHIVQMKYTIPLSASHGNPSEVSDDTAVMHVLPQPTAESKRVLIILRNGQITLWDIPESKSIFRTGGNILQSLNHETKKVTSACWACPFGSKVVVGYSNGEILIWTIPSLNIGAGSASEFSIQNNPASKLNLGYKSDKISIGSIKWVYADAKASRLYVTGASDYASSNLLQVILLNEHTDSRTVKLGLHLSECCIDIEIISTSSEQSKHKQESLLLLGKSGHIYVYDDCFIEKYLLQSQSRSTLSLPKEVVVKVPFTDSSITVSKFVTDIPGMVKPEDEDYIMLAKNYPPLFPVETKQKDGPNLNSSKFSGFSRLKNLYITGHSNGAIIFWDASSPFFTPVLQLNQQSEDDFSLSGIALTALYFNSTSPLLVSGDQSGLVRIFKFKPEPFVTENSFMSLPGSTKKGNSHIIRSVKLIKTNGAVLSLDIGHSLKHLAVGSDQGYVSVIDIEESTVLYQKLVASEICTGIISLQFQTCSLHGFEKNILAVATKDSSVLALDSDTGNTVSTSTVHPKKPSKALFMQILDEQGTPLKASSTKHGLDLSKGNPDEDVTAKNLFLLLCSEKALYVYSLVHVVQGVKKVLHKKKFQSSSCCWASTFYSLYGAGLILLFTSGKVELRSLPDLSLILETSIRGFTYSTPKSNTFSDSQICCSSEGDIVLVNGDQEIFVVSVLIQKNIFSCIYNDRLLSQEGLVPGPIIHKEKKKGIFSSVIKDITGSKAKHAPNMETEDTKETLKELPVIFSNDNFPSSHGENKDSPAMDEDEIELDIDDIDLDDPGEKRRDQNMLGALSKKKLASKFQALKGKLKEMKGNNQKILGKEEQQDEKAGAVDQIKRRYGFSSSNESSVAKLAESKLHENARKLQGINLKATDMQDTAMSFSSLAKEVLRTAEHDRRSS